MTERANVFCNLQFMLAHDNEIHHKAASPFVILYHFVTHHHAESAICAAGTGPFSRNGFSSWMQITEPLFSARSLRNFPSLQA